VSISKLPMKFSTFVIGKLYIAYNSPSKYKNRKLIKAHQTVKIDILNKAFVLNGK